MGFALTDQSLVTFTPEARANWIVEQPNAEARQPFINTRPLYFEMRVY
jgi:hypothetical protein